MKRLPKAVIRVDAGGSTGYGHLVRCVYITKELRSKHVDVLIVVPELDDKIKAVIADLDYVDLASLSLCKSSYIDEIELISRLAGPDAVLLVDGFSIDCEYERIARNYFSSVVAIDGMGRKHASHILIAPSAKAPYSHFDSEYMPIVRHGLGYVLTDPDLVNRNWLRETPDESVTGGKLLINLGGGEHYAEIKVLLNILVAIGFSGDVYVVGCDVECEKYNALNLVCMRWCNYIHDLLMSVDAVIGAAGVAAWERAILGIPSLVFVLAENQKHVAEKLKAEDAASVMFGSPDEFAVGLIKQEIRSVLYDCELREQYNLNSKKCIDGRGVKRVSEEIVSLIRGC